MAAAVIAAELKKAVPAGAVAVLADLFVIVVVVVVSIFLLRWLYDVEYHVYLFEQLNNVKYDNDKPSQLLVYSYRTLSFSL